MRSPSPEAIDRNVHNQVSLVTPYTLCLLYNLSIHSHILDVCSFLPVPVFSSYGGAHDLEPQLAPDECERFCEEMFMGEFRLVKL